MKIRKRNIFNILDSKSDRDEIFEDIISNPGILLERIISTGQVTPEGEWYDQERDEWVLLLQGEATLQFEQSELLELKPGDYVFLPAHLKHRVVHTSIKPPCIWLALHY